MPLISTVPVGEGPHAPWLDRLVAVAIAGAGIAAVVVLQPLHADARGYDTHVQLGLVPCGWPRLYGVPCPTCGCTTAAAHVVHGQLLQAVRVQPFGAAACLALLLSAAFCLWALWCRRSVLDVLAQLPFGRLVLGGVALLLLSWLYKYLTFTPS